jgi:CubicO group peptidase (beta-lactamase class C family)
VALRPRREAALPNSRKKSRPETAPSDHPPNTRQRDLAFRPLRRRNHSSRALGIVVAIFIGRLAAAASIPSIDQRIERIQSNLLPPVLVKGENVKGRTLADRMEALHVPGVSIAVLHGGRLEWARGFGVVSIGGAPVTPETLFQAASISKPVTTLAALRLVEDRKLKLDIDINRYMRTWKLPENEFTRKSPVTLRGLLTHSAGITVHGFAGYASGQPLPTLEQVLNGESPANNEPIRVDTEPGKGWRYSGGGFVVLQRTLMDTTGAPFPRLMYDLVLSPLGMKQSSFQQPLPAKLLAGAAMPYSADGSAVQGGPHTYPELAAAGLWTTPSDLARFIRGIQRALSGTSTRLLSPATARLMLTPVYDQQAIGFIVGGHSIRRYFSHGGANAGYGSYLLGYQDGDGVVVMTNSDGGNRLIPEILRTVAYEYGWPDLAPRERVIAAVDPEAFGPCAGAYRLPAGDIATFWRHGKHIWGRISGQGASELFPEGEREYFLKVVDARWVFSSNSGGGGAPSVILDQNDRQLVATRLSGAEGQAALDWSIAIEDRVKRQAPAAGSETALRAWLVGVADGTPDYDAFTPAIAEDLRAHLPEWQKWLSAPGRVLSITFDRVAPNGEDVYDVKYDGGTREWHINLDSSGRVEAVGTPHP